MTEFDTISSHDIIDENPLPSEAEVAGYEKRGWYKSRRIIPASLLEDVREAIMAHQSGKRDHVLPRSAKFSDWRPGDGDGVRNNEFCSLQNDTVRKLIDFPSLGAIAARLSRSHEIRLFDDQAIYKPPAGDKANGAIVGWHTDHSYWSTCTSERMLTAWVPFEDATLENGTLCVVDGSHKWPEVENVRGFNNPKLEEIEEQLGRKIPSSRVTPMVLKKGEVSFHHMRALHCSAPNRSPTPRLALAIHVQDGNNRYRPYTTPSGQHVVLPHDALCSRNSDGTPDYTDPQVFPTLWRSLRAGQHDE